MEAIIVFLSTDRSTVARDVPSSSKDMTKKSLFYFPAIFKYVSCLTVRGSDTMVSRKKSPNKIRTEDEMRLILARWGGPVWFVRALDFGDEIANFCGGRRVFKTHSESRMDEFASRNFIRSFVVLLSFFGPLKDAYNLVNCKITNSSLRGSLPVPDTFHT